MHLIAKIIRISRDKFHCNRLTAVLDIQGDASLIFCGTQCIYSTYWYIEHAVIRNVTYVMTFQYDVTSVCHVYCVAIGQ